MTKHEQTKFVEGLINNVKDELMSQINKLPDEWDGHELRQLIADRFAEVSFTLKNDKKRYRAYRNFIITTPLRT